MMCWIWECRDLVRKRSIIPYVHFLSYFLFRNQGIPASAAVTRKDIKQIKNEVRGLTFKHQGDVYWIEDTEHGCMHGVGLDEGGGDEEEREYMSEDTDDIVFRARNEAEDVGDPDYNPDGEGTSRGRRYVAVDADRLARLEEQNALLLDTARAQIYLQERYQQEAFIRDNRRRQYDDELQKVPVTPYYTPVDYTTWGTQFSSDADYQDPPAPSIAPPLFYQQPEPFPPHIEQEREQGRKSVFDMAPLSRSLFDSIFGPDHRTG